VVSEALLAAAMAALGREGGGDGGAEDEGEWREEFEARGGDKTFRKFSKRLERCPSQVVRWGGGSTLTDSDR
jgi:hypothetical protein